MKFAGLATALSPVTALPAFADDAPKRVSSCDQCKLQCYDYQTEIRYLSGGIVRDLVAEVTYFASDGATSKLGAETLTTSSPGTSIPAFHVCVGERNASPPDKSGVIFELRTNNSSGSPPLYYESFQVAFSDSKPFHVVRTLDADP